MAHAIGEPAYTLVRQYPGFEVRAYGERLVAEVVVPGPPDNASNEGFRILAAYIFGRNVERSGARSSTRIAMTAPVNQLAADQPDAYVIQFMMPPHYTVDTVPRPLDSRIHLHTVPGGRFAVIRYSGTWTEHNYRGHLAQLEDGVARAGLRTTGAAIYARYDAPWKPWFMRRNEIWLRLTD